MNKVTGLVLVIVIAGGGVAYGDSGRTAKKTARWDSVEALQQNALIEVGRANWAGADVCRVEKADDSELVCVAERPEGDARLVFPRDTVKDVWVIERAKNLHIERWIVVGIGVALVVAACVEGGVFGLAIVGTIVLGVEVSYFENSVWNQAPQPPPMRRRLVYSVP